MKTDRLSRSGSEYNDIADRFKRNKLSTYNQGKITVDKGFLLNSQPGKLLKSQKNANSHMAPFDKYANTCDKHFKYSVYTMKKESDEKAVQDMAEKRVRDKIALIDTENSKQKKEFYKQLEAYNQI